MEEQLELFKKDTPPENKEPAKTGPSPLPTRRDHGVREDRTPGWTRWMSGEEIGRANVAKIRAMLAKYQKSD